MSRQLALALRAPAEHADFVHTQKRHGTVLIWKQQDSSRQWIKVQSTDDMALAMSEHLGQVDRYFTPNEFMQWRRVDLLRSLRAVYVDLDGCTDWKGVLEFLSELGLPSPTLIVESGRGLHLYWLLEPTPAKALPVWQALQDFLVSKLQAFGSDPSARDCTRVLRIVGSVNSKNGVQVTGWILQPYRWTLHELADAVMGPRKLRPAAQVVGLECARAKRQASVHQRTGPYRLWHNRFQDLIKITEHHAFMRPEGVGEGNRDNLLFLLSVALSWFTNAQGLTEHIERVAKTYMPSLSMKEVRSYMKPVLSRAHAAARGETYEWKGRQKDPRYEFRTLTIRARLGALITPALEPQLIALGVPKSAEETQAIRKAQKATHEKKRSRAQEGRYAQTRDKYSTQAAERAQKAQELRETGLSLRAIAFEMSISKSRAEQYLKGVQCAPVLV